MDHLLLCSRIQSPLRHLCPGQQSICSQSSDAEILPLTGRLEASQNYKSMHGTDQRWPSCLNCISASIALLVFPSGKTLELKLDSQAQRRRKLKDRSLAIERIWELDKVSARNGAVSSQRLVLSHGALAVEDIEPISLYPQLPTFTKFDRVVGAQIQVIGCRRPISAGQRINRRAARHPESFVVPVDGMWNQCIEGNARLDPQRRADQKIEGRLVTAVKLKLVRAIIRQTAIRVRQQTLK